MSDDLVRPTADAARALAAACDGFPSRPEARRLALRLREGLAVLDAPAGKPRPLVVALMGGTGVGKSHLFNALVGVPEASPTSPDVRPKTARPAAAVSRADRPDVRPLLNDLGAAVVEADLSGVVFLDTPDVDSVEEANRAATRKVIDACDVVVYVTEPRKRADFAVQDEVRAWAARKRWYFALNRADEVDAALPAVCDDFRRRLRELGFDPTDDVFFAVSALHPHRYRFAELRAALFARRGEHRRALLPADRFLGRLLHAAEPELTGPLEKAAGELAAAEARLDERVRSAYARALGAPEVTDALAGLVREQTWRHLAARVAGPAGVPVWMRARLGVMTTAVQAGSLLMRGPSLWLLAATAAGAVADVVRGLLPLRRVVGALGDEFRREIDAVRTDARRVLEDHRLAGPPAPPPAEASAPATPVVGGVLGSVVEPVLARLAAPPPDDELVRHLNADIDQLARAKARAASGGWFTQLVVNLLPVAAIADVVYRLGEAWVRHHYLHLDFYLMAAGVLAASVLPGYIVLSLRVGGRTDAPDPGTLVRQMNEPLATAELRDARARLGRLASDAARLRGDAVAARLVLAEELDAASFGATTAGSQ